MPASKDRLYKDVEFLTSIQPPRNYLNKDSLEKVCYYLKKEFMLMGASPVEQTWKAEGTQYKNIIASYNTDKKRRLIVGAHYDVAGNQPGADDNASAVAGLLELGRFLNEHHAALTSGVELVAYSLEEPPYFATSDMGSAYHAAQTI